MAALQNARTFLLFFLPVIGKYDPTLMCFKSLYLFYFDDDML